MMLNKCEHALATHMGRPIYSTSGNNNKSTHSLLQRNTVKKGEFDSIRPFNLLGAQHKIIENGYKNKIKAAKYKSKDGGKRCDSYALHKIWLIEPSGIKINWLVD
jgi:hypothetical protein